MNCVMINLEKRFFSFNFVKRRIEGAWIEVRGEEEGVGSDVVGWVR